MSDLPFRKLHGLGNDFIVLDGVSTKLPVELLADAAPRLCHRHLGIGADGLLLVLPPEAPGRAQALMRVINADGSEAETCGNGIRCVAKVLGDHDPRLREATTLTIETAGKPARCDLRRTDGQVTAVRVEMGAPSLERPEIPMGGQGRFVDEPIAVDDEQLVATAVNMGNPHLVLFTDDADRRLAERLGPLLEHHPIFPARANIGLARITDDGVELWVWERGCGLTQACGSGACAAAVAAVLTERHTPAKPLAVTLPGGTLTIEVAADLSQVWMEGPVEEVYTGTLPFATA